jgi:RecA/RadA recombinase
MFRSGLKALDQALFDGNGVPPGSLVELCGATDSAKTALALWFCRQAQEEPEAVVGWVCVESNIARRNLVWAGVDPDGVLLGRQTLARPGLRIATEMVENGCRLVVIDSIAALMDGEIERPLTQVLSAGLYPLKDAAVRHGAVVVLTNQERAIPPKRVTSHAGSCPALNRLVDYQIRLEAGQGIYRGGKQEGVRVYFKVVKNGPDPDNWGKTGRFACHWEQGLKDIKQYKGETENVGGD